MWLIQRKESLKSCKWDNLQIWKVSAISNLWIKNCLPNMTNFVGICQLYSDSYLLERPTWNITIWSFIDWNLNLNVCQYITQIFFLFLVLSTYLIAMCDRMVECSRNDNFSPLSVKCDSTYYFLSVHASHARIFHILMFRACLCLYYEYVSCFNFKKERTPIEKIEAISIH